MSESTLTLEGALRSSQETAIHIKNHTVEAKNSTDTTPELEGLARLQAQIDSLRARSELRPSAINKMLQLAKERGLTEGLLDQTSRAIRTRPFNIFFVADDLAELQQRVTPHGKKLKDVITEVVHPSGKEGMIADARYIPISNQIVYAATESTPLDTLQSLAFYGELPSRTTLSHHEWMHAAQFNLGEGIRIPPELLEAQAYRAEPVSRYFGFQTINHVVTSPAYQHLDPRRLASAYYSLDRLNALGYSQNQIIRIIGRAGQWDETSGFWTDLDQTMRTEMERRGIDNDGLERRVVGLHLQRTLAIQQARLSTQRVLREAFQDEIGPNTESRKAHHRPLHRYVRERHAYTRTKKR